MTHRGLVLEIPSHLKMNCANSFIVCNYEAKNSWPAQILMGWVKSAVGGSREEHGSYCRTAELLSPVQKKQWQLGTKS